RVEVAAQRARVAVRTKVERAAILAIDSRAALDLETRLHADDADPVPADPHPVRGPGQHDTLKTRPHEGPLPDVPVDPVSVRRDADRLLAQEGGERAEEFGVPVPARVPSRCRALGRR